MRRPLIVSLGVLSLLFFGGTAEASTRTLAHYMGGGTHLPRLGMTLVRTGRLVALTEGDAASAPEPGSVPLAPREESRIARYIIYDDCPRTTEREKDILIRCQYLLNREHQIQRTAESVMRLSPRARTRVTRGAITRRTVETRYRQDIDTTNKFLHYGKNEGGALGRPRNFSETPTAFGEAVRLKRRLLRAVAPEVEPQ